MATIMINNVPFHYEKVEISYDKAQYLDQEIAKENLLLFKKVMDNNKSSFFLMYGTLLGAIRENGFIKYDIDIDTCTQEEEKLINTIPLLAKEGLMLCRHIPGVIYSFIRKNIYIDVYVVKKASFIWRWKYCLCAGELFPRALLAKYKTIFFLETTYTIPANPIKVLKYLYGKNWKIPIKDYPGDPVPYFITLWRKLPQPVRSLLRPLKNYLSK